MEYNKDESLRCLDLSSAYLSKGDKEKALKFAKKSQQLYPSDRAKALVEKIERLGECSTSERISADTASDGSRFRKRSSNADSNGSASKFTQEQVNGVNRIKRCKDYYEILGIDKNADDNEIKKKYRKLALQFHPDKNGAPGAIEAFKAIGNAFSVLSDPAKRRKYDLSGPDTHSSSSNRQNTDWDYSHGFESDMSAEEIFNMFFGGRAFTNVTTTTHSTGATAHTFRRHHHHNVENWSQLLLQLSPIFILVLLSVISMSFVGETPYSFVQSIKYPERRVSENLEVVYFVMRDFSKNNQKSAVLRIDREVESVYVSNLRQACHGEQTRKENMKLQAKYQSDARAYEQAERFEMKSCIQLEELYR